MKKNLLALFLSIIVAGCATTQTTGDGREIEIVDDARPPYGYDPSFIRKIEKLDLDKHKEPLLEISSVDTRQPNKIKIKAHLIDSNNTYLTGATDKEMRNIWCEVVNTYFDAERLIDDYKVFEITEADREPYAIALVMDHSGSMGERRARVVQNAVKDFIEKKKDEDALSLIKYDSKIVTESPLIEDKNLLTSSLKINGLAGFGGMTAINDALAAAIENLKKAKITQNRVAVVFTDGVDNSSRLEVDSLIRLARQNNVNVCAVDFGDNVDESYLKAVTESTGGIYKHIYGTEEFNLVFEDIYARLKNFYSLEFTPLDYGRQSVSVKLCLKEVDSFVEKYFDNTPAVGNIGVLKINFDFGKANISYDSKYELDCIFALLMYFPDMRIEIQGHTDSINRSGDPDFNKKLSAQRAESVKQALFKMGIDMERISTRGFGSEVPIADNSTKEGRAKNRRTEFVITKMGE